MKKKEGKKSPAVKKPAPAKKLVPTKKPAPVAPEEEKQTISKSVELIHLADVTKVPDPDHWFTYIDHTGGHVETFFKYTGNLIYAYSEDDMKDENLNKLMKSVVLRGMKLIISFQDTSVDFLKFIHPGALPAEIFSPEQMHDEEMILRYKDPDSEAPIRSTGQVAFVFSKEESVPAWAKEKTVLVHVTP